MFEFLLHLERYLPNKVNQARNKRQALINRALKVHKEQAKLLDNLGEDTKDRLRDIAIEKIFKIKPKI
jgi:hypothetical protein